MSKCVTSQHVSVFKQHSKKGLKQFLLLCLVSLCLLALTACGTTASGVQPPGPAEPDLPGEQDIPATPNPETFTDLSLVLHDEVSWAAIQQGDEAWRVVRKPGELSPESMPRVKGEFGFAYVCQHERRADVYLQMADTRDIAERERIVRCSSGVQDEVEEEIYHLGGLVSGVDVGEGGYIFAGSRTPAEFFHRAESQKLEYDFPRLFSEGKYDLIALKGRGNLSEFLPGKAIIKRDEAIIKDSIVDFDFDTEAVDLTKHKISLTNLAFEEEETPYLGLLFSTKNLLGTSRIKKKMRV